MRITITAMTLAMCLVTGPSCSQTAVDEIQILVSKAPVVEAVEAGEDGVGPMIVSRWLTTLSYSGRVDDAFAALSKIKNIEPDDLLSAIAEGLAIAGRTDDALAIARRIKYNTDSVVMILAEGDRISEALAEARKIENDEYYHSIKSAEYYRSRILRHVAMGLARRGKTDQAIAVTREIKDNDFSSEALGVIAEELAKAGKGTEAMAVARAINNDLKRVTAFKDIAGQLACAGKADEALDAAYEIAGEDTRAQAFFTITEGLTQAGNVDRAMIVARKIKDYHLLSISLAAVIKGLMKQGRNDEANSALNEALTAAATSKDERALSSISIALAEAGRPSDALTIARPITNDSTRAWTFEAISKALVKEGKLDEALAVARLIGESLNNRSGALAAVAEGLAQAGKTEQALAIASKGFHDSASDQAAVTAGLAKGGKVDEAMAAAREIDDEEYRSIAFADIAVTLARSHSYRQARLAADLCPSPLSRLIAYNTILNEYEIQTNPQLRALLEAEEASRNP